MCFRLLIFSFLLVVMMVVANCEIFVGGGEKAYHLYLS